jgi:hypothetical protein
MKVRTASIAAARRWRDLSLWKAADLYIANGGEHSDSRGAARSYLRRLELRGPEVEMTAEEAEAIAKTLGLRVDHLEGELLWYFSLDGVGAYPVGEQVFAFSDAAEAMDRRAALALAGYSRANEIQIAPTTRSILLGRPWPEYALLEGLPDATLARPDIHFDPADWLVKTAVVLEDVLVNGRPPEKAREYLAAIEATFNLPRIRQQLAHRLELALMVDPARADRLAEQARRLAALIDAANAEGMERVRGLLDRAAPAGAEGPAASEA